MSYSPYLSDEDWALTECAAKAAGLVVWRGHGGDPLLLASGVATFSWDPLNDNNAAFVLAARLNIDVIFDATPNGPLVECRHEWGDGLVCVSENFCARLGPQPEVAMRRAIVRAAAKIGKTMRKGEST